MEGAPLLSRSLVQGLVVMATAVGSTDTLATTIDEGFISNATVAEELETQARSVLRTEARKPGSNARNVREIRVRFDDSRQLFVVTFDMHTRGGEGARAAIESICACRDWENCWLLNSYRIRPQDYEFRALYRGRLQAKIAGEVAMPVGRFPLPSSVQVDELPVPMYSPKPKYPEGLKQSGLDAAVVLQALVGDDGSVRDLRVIKSVSAGLDSAAAQAVRQWRFRPAMIGKTPVSVWIAIPVRFPPQEK